MFQVSRLREWRERRMLSTRELAELAGVGEATIWRLEGGKTARPATIRADTTRIGIGDGMANGEATGMLRS